MTRDVISKDELLIADPNSDITEVVCHFLGSAGATALVRTRASLMPLEGAGIN